MSPTVLNAVILLIVTCDEPLVPWSSNVHPSDVPKRHVVEITDKQAQYTIVQGGTMDGRNCSSPQGVWQPFHQTWESNRSVRIENVGQTDVLRPWLSNGYNNFRSVQEIIERAVEPGMPDREKAMALWWQEVQYRFHFEGDNDELLDPVKVFNVYGHNTCGNDSICLAGQWRRAGLRVAPARLVGHCVSQVFYDGAWHLMDGDMQSIYLLRDNETVAGEQDLVRDHDLIKRTHTQGILQPDRRSGDEWESSIYVFEGEVNGDRNFSADTNMDMTLRPGEALVWRWGRTDPVKHHGSRQHKFPDRICNGLWEYRPDFTERTWRAGAVMIDGIVEHDGELAAEPGKTGVVVWSLRSPYVFVGGRLDADATGVRFAVSWDGKQWEEGEEAGSDLDRLFARQERARYAYFLRCELAGAARLRQLRIINDVQMAPLTLPGMGIGKNVLTYTDQTIGARKIRITHEWVERSTSKPPAAPPSAISPPDRGQSEGTETVFEWHAAPDPDRDAIADYHFELSARPDMKWPLSMSFAKLISRTPDAGNPRYTLPEPGLLNPGREYYWHVRAQDDKGVWGPWSETWSFTARGPAPPLDVAVQFDAARRRGTLRWRSNPIGRSPTSYRVYASDEKGFSISDEPYPVTIGSSKELLGEFAANFVINTEACELAVVGGDVALPGANKAFYRVVAVDEHGNRSGPSDYASVPRPVIVTMPVSDARQGVEYRYAVRVIRSLGDLRTRVIDGKETMGFWDIERLRYSIERGPQWLTIDSATGIMSGTPGSAGKFPVEIAVTAERDRRQLDEAALKWGIEKVISSGPAVVGRSTQSFVIEVRP